MIGENIAKLRKQNRWSQEELAERVGVSRQTIAKWESGESTPDLQYSATLAEQLNVSLDDLVTTSWEEDHGIAPKGKYVFGPVTVGEKGQIVIPKKAREHFKIRPGDTLLVLGDDSQGGLALLPSGFVLEFYERLKRGEM